MKWFVSLFEKKKKEDKFEIEYYPLTGIWVVKVNGKYLSVDSTTGFVEINEYTQEIFNLQYASHLKTEEEAGRLIELFKEQKQKKNVLIKEVK